MHIHSKSLSKEAVLAAVEQARANDVPWREGKLYAYVFDGGAEVEEVGKKAYMAYLTENGLDPTTFPSLLRFENDLVDLARRHLGGDEHVVGNFTSGGTESIMLAVKTARDAFREKHPDVERPEMLVPITAHAAFHKAAHYLGVKAVITAVDPETFRADVADMRGKLNERTMLVVASASSYAHGVIDPVREIAALAREHGVLCHVDGCMGGFLLPYFRRLGAAVPDFDFRVPGVTSMSMDLHKYGLTPKGASIVLYANEALRRHQIFACSDWTGYTMINNTIQSSKSGGPMAAAWAVLQFVGDEGYLRYARGLLEAKNAIVAGVNAIPGLQVMGDPEMSLVAFTSDELSVFAIADEMKARGFHVQAQLKHGPSKENIHVSINPSNVQHTAAMLEALRAAVEAVRAAGGGPKPPVEMAQMLAATIEADTTGEGLGNLVAALGAGPGGELPGKMAETNALLNELPPKTRERLLVAFMGHMFTPRSA
ncbi:MAG: aspartate aminotransferase family protein [Deltaproteobacteria bacterium]|nr:aspartate aminotransferase family protein [Deltaproteobacteria bacterium]